MATVFFFLFGAIGAMVPYLSLHYHRVGLSGMEISLLMAVSPVLLFISQPIFGPLADRSGDRGRLLSWLLVAAGTAGALLAFGESFWTLLPLVALWAFFAGPLIPTADSIALGEVAARGGSYAVLRLWGSIGFLLITIVLGRFYNWVGDLRWAFLAYGLLNLMAFFFARRLPADGVAARRAVWPEVKRLMANPFLLGFLLLSCLVQTTQAAHVTFFSVHLESVGGTSGTVGLAWGLAALTEVPVWLVLGRVTKRTGPLPLLAFGGLMFAARWWIYGVVSDPVLLVWLQLLQGLSFAVFLPTVVVLMSELTPPDLRTTGQSLLFMVNGGLGNVLGMLGAGRLVDAVGTAGMYRVTSAVAAVAGVGFLLLHAVRLAWARRAASAPGD